jgi:hypothetical protein
VRPGSGGWWLAKLRQARRHLGARVTAAERAELSRWLTPAQQRLFDGMHVADRRHGLDVIAWLRADGIGDPDVLLAGLLHDAGKDTTGFVPRVVYSLWQAYGPRVWSLARLVPPLAVALVHLKAHPERSAALAAAAGCSPRTVELIRLQDDSTPTDRDGQRLHLADEAS